MPGPRSLLTNAAALTDAARQARTVSAILGSNAVLAGGLAAGAVLGTRRGRNLSVGPAFDLALAIAGVRVEVEGAEHLERPRPAIFAFNHQSNLDPLVVITLVRHDFTSTGKAEVRKDPLAVFTALAIDAVLIDRHDPEAARAQMAVAAKRLRGGESVLIAPEGTRSLGAEPGPFRTGVVHLALAAGVPIVPVVLHGAGDLMPGRAIRPGTVRAQVLEAVDTGTWKAGTARAHAAELQELMAAELRRGPAVSP